MEWRQNEGFVALIVQVPSVVASTVDACFESRRVRLTFESERAAAGGSSRVGRVPHVVELRLAGTVVPDGCRYDAADNNMMVVLQKEAHVEWPDLEAAAEDGASGKGASSKGASSKGVGGTGASGTGASGTLSATPSAEPKAAPAFAPSAEPALQPGELVRARPAEEAASPQAGADQKQYDKLLFELD